MIYSVIKYLFFLIIVKPFIYLVLGVSVTGAENLPKVNSEPSILVANHNSHIDTLLLMSLFSCSQILKIHPVAASDYFCNTKLGAFIFKYLIGIIPISRKVHKSTTELFFKDLNEALVRNETIIIYPEGTRGESSDIKTFKSGVAHIAKMNPNVPVIPIYINGPDKILPKGDILWVPFICDVYIGEHLYYDGSSTKEFTAKVQAAVQKLKDDHKRREEL